MLSAVRKRMTWANVAMTLALVFAMTGGAYAAKKYLITSTKQISPKVLAQLKGAKGPAGAPGAAGPAGPQGPAGANGKDGANGAAGKDGVSVTSSKETAGANCKAGGSKLVSAGGTEYVCNGENGQTGFTETLPENKTEKGEWVVTPVSVPAFPGTIEGVGAISFVIPLQGAPTLVYIPEGEEGKVHVAECPGTAEAPEATAGYLCIYTTFGLGATFEAGSATTHAFGAHLVFTGANAGVATYGSWAVTAE